MGDPIQGLLIPKYRRKIMAKNLRKVIALLSAAAVISALLPTAFALQDGTQIDGTDFTGVTLSSDGKNRFLQSTTATNKDLGNGVVIANGARSDGANGNTGWYGKSGFVEAAIGQYVSAGRGPYMYFNVDGSSLDGQRVTLTFKYNPKNGTGNTADLYIVDNATGLDVDGNTYNGTETPTLSVGKELTESTWNNIKVIIETDGKCIVLANDKLVTVGTMTASTLPYLRFTQTVSSKDLQSTGGIDDVYFYTGGETTNEDFAGWEYGMLELEDQEGAIVKNGTKYNVSAEFSLPTASIDGSEITWNVYQKLKGGNTLEETTLASTDQSKVTPNPGSELENYDVVLVATIKYGDYETTKEFPLTLKMPQEIADEVAGAVTIAYADSTSPEFNSNTKVYTVTKDLALATAGDYNTTITWECLNEAATESDSRISSTGVIYPNDSDDKVVLRATVKFGDATATKDFVIQLPNAVTDYIDPVITALTVASADDKTVTYPVASIGTVKTDIALPTRVRLTADSYVGITWKVSSENAELSKDNVVEYTTSDFNEHDVTITGTFSYVKNDTNVVSKTADSYSYKVQFTSSDVESTDSALDKYKVRFDAAYDENFESIPSSATSDINLPTTGYFGSKFVWSSSAPTVISNSGKYTRPTSSKSVNLAATIISGSASVIKNFAVSVAGSNNNGGGGGGGGGSVSSTGTTNKGTSGGAIYSSNTGAVASEVTSAADRVSRLQEEALASNDLFTDIPQAAWAREEINGLAKAGVINGKTDTLFAPNDTVTRAEFAKMLMGTLGLASNAYTTSSFRDVPTDAWYFAAVESAYNLGIINGVSAGTFAPNALITRQDMAVMVARAAEIAGKTISETAEAKAFADEGSIADYAKASVDTLVKGGVINGMSDTEFAPLANATRAQAAKILYRFL